MGVREKTASGRGLDGYGIFLKYVKSADIKAVYVNLAAMTGAGPASGQQR
jgi:hypothetical protein